jgi:hypothetical protein
VRVLLRFTEGPRAGEEIAIPRGSTILGSEQRGRGQLEGSGVAAKHVELIWDWHLLWVMPHDGEVELNGERWADLRLGTQTTVDSGAVLTIGEHTLSVLIDDQEDPFAQAEKEVMRQAMAGGQPLRYAVEFERDGGEKANGILEARGTRIDLVDATGTVAFDAEIAELGEVDFPGLKSNTIKFETGGSSYKIWLLQRVWLPQAVDYGRVKDAADTSRLLDDPAPVTSFEAYDTAEDIGDAINLAFSALGSLDRRSQRRDWKKVLAGETAPEELAAERAKDDLAALEGEEKVYAEEWAESH